MPTLPWTTVDPGPTGEVVVMASSFRVRGFRHVLPFFLDAVRVLRQVRASDGVVGVAFVKLRDEVRGGDVGLQTAPQPALAGAAIPLGQDVTELARRAPRTVVHVDVLRRQLDAARERNLAFEHEESAVGITCVAAAIREGGDLARAAVSVTGPVHRFAPERHATAVRAAGSTRTMRLNFASDSVTPWPCGSAPPDRPVPAPRATTGTSSRWQTSSTACTCRSVSGSATTSGRCRYAVRPSHS